MKLDYISILAGGSCKFNCDFCVGKDIRKNITPHISPKYKAFIECFAEQTDLLSISGDTSDPSFVEEIWEIPEIAKEVNPNIKVTIHTRNIEAIHKTFVDNCFDKFVFSIDENITKETLQILKHYKKKVRLSFVMTESNYSIVYNWLDELPEIFDFQMTIRPEVHQVQNNKILFESTFRDISSNSTITELSSGAVQLNQKPNIWYWDYRKTNDKINTMYLFSSGEISNNCKWSEII